MSTASPIFPGGSGDGPKLAPKPAPAPTECEQALDRLEEFARHSPLLLKVNRGTSSLSAQGAEVAIFGSCSSGRAELEVTTPDADVSFTVDSNEEAISLETRFADGSLVYRDAELDEAGGAPIIVAGAIVDDEQVQVVGDDLAYGDPATVNERLRPRLQALGASPVASALVAWSGIGEVFAGEAAAKVQVHHVLDALVSVPVPSQAATDSDHVNTNRVCTVGIFTCGSAIFVPALAVGCYAAGVACMAAATCEINDCGDDGYND